MSTEKCRRDGRSRSGRAWYADVELSRAVGRAVRDIGPLLLRRQRRQTVEGLIVLSPRSLVEVRLSRYDSAVYLCFSLRVGYDVDKSDDDGTTLISHIAY